MTDAAPPSRPGSMEEWLSSQTPQVRRMVERARRTILGAVPHAIEKLRPGWGLLGYNAPAYFAFIVPGAVGPHAPVPVRIGFEWGVKLPDPAGVLEGSGSQVRYFVVRTPSDLENPSLATLLREAAALKSPARKTARGR